MPEIADWLQKLGLGQYAHRFVENDIDFRVLPDLTDQDLKDLGVTSLGHRRLLLRAIIESKAAEKGPTTAAAELTSPVKADAAERRQVTVMFSDLVGSTALSTRLDPEDLREVISAYQKCVAETVRRFDGFVAKYMGDGVLVYFGYPQAHEDDAERAVRAGLELVASVGALKTHAPLQTRVGLATGLVVVGDLIGSGASQEQAIVGETPNLAARLQGTAEPNSVVIAESTRKLLGNLFELEYLGARDLKGISGPVRGWVALRPASVESRFDALHASGLTELVGREEELELLLRRWSKAKSGEGQVVMFSGEPGIGKSRLTAALLERLAAEPHTRLRNFCSPQHTDSALYPTIGQIERAAGFKHDDASQVKLDKLDMLLAQSSTSLHDAALLSEMLSLPNDGRYPVLELTPQRRRQKTLDALVLQVVALARQNPVLMIFEDAHWTDPTSLELFDRIVDKISDLPVLLIVTYRPEFDAPWIGRPHVTAVTLNRLGKREIDAMIDRVTGNKALPEPIRQDIIERTDGIPLFVEEMTKAVLEAESEGDARSTAAAVPISSLAVPASLHASLMARLDRLGSAKEVAQIGAAIGREFSHALLTAVMDKSEVEVSSALDRLIVAGLLFKQGAPPHANYLFKHALVQDAAYGTLLREKRRTLHARIAQTLESQFPELAENRPELLAHHLTQAGLTEDAVEWWGKAGQRSLERFALIEAVAQFTRALDQVASLPATPAHRRQQIKLQVGLANAVYHTKGMAATETRAAFDQARVMIEHAEGLGEHVEDPLLLYSVLYGFFIAKFIKFDGDTACALARQFLALAEQQKATAPIMIGHRSPSAQRHQCHRRHSWRPAHGSARHDGQGLAACEEYAAYRIAALSDKLVGVAGSAAAMQQVADWLKKLGFGQYAQRFAENDISFSVLPDLTDQDLKEIGVSLGHRRQLLRAIANLDRAAAAPALPTTWAPIAVTPVTRPAEAPGERRHVTVMFCDLVDSTGIAAQLDAEEWRDLVGAYVDAASAAVVEMGGKVVNRQGDGLMALFGFPVAQENDAERAARAALASQRALAELNRKNTGTGKPALAARIAIDSGPVVVNASGEIFGDVPNIAARAQALAELGTVVVTARVQRQVAGLFVVEERGNHELKGVPEPVTLYRLVRASGAGRRAGQRRLTPLVGRDEEIAMLMRRWERAQRGNGQLVLVVGEPGLGKSRLLEEFHSRLREVPHTWTEWNCSQILQSTPLHPIAEWGRQRFGGAEVPVERRLGELESSLAHVKLDPVENVPLLAPLLDIPLPAERVPALAPEELRRRQFAALTNWVLASAQTQPIVLALEDVHWADPTTIDFLRGIAERGVLAPLLVLITARPEFRPAWGMRSHHSTISLAPLDRDQVRDMVVELSARHALSKEVIENVAERTGGVPLFVEEVTRLLLERGTEGGIQAVPPTLQQSLTARLDRLGPAREVALIGAVIGRDFYYPLLRAVAGMEDAPLQTALDRLAEADILLVQGLPPNSDYRFTHSLIQDAAYENLLKSRRQLLHQRVAEVLHDMFPTTAAAEPELLAHHFTRAGQTEAAVEWLGKAGQRSLERSALAEAIEQFTRALAQIATLPPTPALRRKEIELQVALITPLIHVKGHASPHTKAAGERAGLLIEQAEALGEAPEDRLLLFSVLYGFWVANEVAFNGDACLDLAAQFLARAEKQADPIPLMIGHRLMGSSLLFVGEVAESRTHFDRTISLYNPTEHRLLATGFAHDVRVITLCYRSWALWLLGHPSLAVADADEAVRNAREISQAATLMSALCFASLPHVLSGRYAAANALLDEVVGLADEKGALIWKTFGMMNQGYVRALTGRTSDAIHIITAGIAAWQSTGSTVFAPSFLTYLASSYADIGQFDEALRCIDEAMATIDTTKEKWWEAEVNRVAGEILLKSLAPETAKAETHFEQALAIARKQQAKSLELRAAMSIARLRRDQGKRDEARDLLAPIYGWFPEGFDTLDLREAKTLLAMLG